MNNEFFIPPQSPSPVAPVSLPTAFLSVERDPHRTSEHTHQALNGTPQEFLIQSL